MTTITTTNLTLNNVYPKNGGNYSLPFSIRELNSGIKFEAYSSQSGPNYGGEVELFDAGNKPHYLRQDIYEMLYAFDVWIEK